MPSRYVPCDGAGKKAQNQTGEPVTQPCPGCGQQIGTRKARVKGKTIHVFTPHEKVIEA